MRWEYKVINFSKRSFFTGAVDAQEMERVLNDLGRDSWELASASQNQMQRMVLVLKRPK